MKNLFKIFAVVCAFTFVIGCSSGSSDEEITINVSGGTAVVPIVDAGYQEFKKEHTNVIFNINSDGSSAGIKAASEGVSQIGLSGRDLKDDEKKLGLTETMFARDALGVVINSELDIKDLSSEQLNGIYSGKITNWKEVGGEDLAITVVSREDGSGSRDVFEEKLGLLDGDGKSLLATDKAIIANSTGAVVENIETKKGAIGYVSIGELDNEKIKAVTVDGIAPTQENVLANKYAINRPFIMISKDESDTVKAFLEFMLSEEGQKIVVDKGLVSVK